MRNPLPLLIVLVAALAAGCGKGATEPAGGDAQAIPVQVRPAAKGPIEQAVSLPGRIVANREAVLTAKAPGRVSRVAVGLGEAVRRGQVLVSLEAADLAAQAEQARVAYDNAQANYDRMKLLYDEGAVSRQQWEQAVLQRTQAATALDLARSALENAAVVAPFDGYVTSLPAKVGETASPGLPLVTVVDISRLYLESGVADTHAARVRPGQEVRVEAEALPGVAFTGRVEAVSPAADSQHRTFPVRVALPDPPPGLKAGMFARAVLALDRREAAVTVPVEAVVGEGARRRVYVVEGGVAREREVETGLTDGVAVEILRGVSAGEPVVVVGQQYLKDGARVRVAGTGGEAP